MPSVSPVVLRAPAQPVDVKPNAWLRNERRTRAWAAIAVLWSVVVVGLLLRTGHLPIVAELIFAFVYLGLAGLGLALAWRVARSGVWVGADGIVVRGPFRTRFIPSADAVAFAPGLQGRGGNGVPCPMLERRDQRPLGVWALGRRNVWFRYERLCQEIQPLCDQLNELIVPRA